MNEATTLNHAADELLSNAPFESLGINELDIGGASVLDFAVGRSGQPSAGVLLAQVCFGNLASVALVDENHELELKEVLVETESPLLACIGGQYAGWPLATDDYFAMCSGPIRMLRGKEEILTEYNLVGESKIGIGVLEANKLPTLQAIENAANECSIPVKRLTLCVARTASHPGLIQVVARSVETTLHKLHELKFDLRTIQRGQGRAPVPPVPDDDMVALGWTNDSILYGASVRLTVSTTDEAISSIINDIPSSSSSEFGTPFLELFKKYEYDFYKIDKKLFSPAQITIHNEKTGNTFKAGQVRNDILKKSFGI